MGLSYLGVVLGQIELARVNRTAKDSMRTQTALLKRILRRCKKTEYGKKFDFSSIKSVSDFQKKIPLTTYHDYENYVERMINNKEKNLMTAYHVSRYCSSSGSVGKPKVLPKTSPDLWHMQCLGFSASVACAYNYLKKHGLKSFPEQMGPLVMVLTGHRLDDGRMCNGAGQVPLTYLKIITPFFSTTPLDFLYPEHEEKIDVSYFQLRFAIENRKVSYLGSLVITLLTTMFDYLENNWQVLCDDIEKGTIDESIKVTDELRRKYEKKFKPNPKRAAELRTEFEKGFDTPIAPRIWPRLTWTYGMVGANLAIYIEKLRKSIGDVPIHNMGYAAAEGYFAVPVELNAHDYAVVPYSVFFEFLPINAHEGTVPLTVNQVEVGKEYELIVTNFSGLYRYRMEDVVRVTGMYKNTPKIEFLYRLNLGMNIANEKTSTQMIDWAAKEISENVGAEFEGHSFYADYSTNPPHYVMLVEVSDPDAPHDAEKYAQLLDEKMKDCNEKYFKYRRWGMIGDPQVLFLKKNTYSDYRESLRNKGVVLNQIKPVTVINSDERKDFFFSHIE
jgi:uncharacterized short protein YbdD (DUF466 family)